MPVTERVCGGRIVGPDWLENVSPDGLTPKLPPRGTEATVNITFTTPTIVPAESVI